MTRTATPRPFLDPFSDLTRQLASAGPSWLQRLRREALDRFETRGFPSTREELWRTTNTAPIEQAALGPASPAPDLEVDGLPDETRLGLGGPRLVFVDGYLRPDLSNDRSANGAVRVSSLARELETSPQRLRPLLETGTNGSGTVFRELNLALAADGALVHVPEGSAPDAPVELVYVSTGRTPAVTFPRSLIVADRGSQIDVVESYVGLGDGVYWTNAVTETHVGDEARVRIHRLQMEGPGAFHTSSSHSLQKASSAFSSHNIDLGGRLARHDLRSILDGEGAECRLNGLYLTHGSQHVDTHTVLDHAKPHGSSRELYKGILDGTSRATFNGRIVVREDAQKTDAKQSNPNLLLSNGALARTRPQLEIYADDVKCTHGATVGRLDEDAIFYLRSRGLDHATARNLLISAFAAEVLEHIGIEPLREALVRTVERRLQDTR